MGITGAHELSHSVKGLSLQELYNVCQYIRKKRQCTSNQPTIDLDASLLYRSSKLSIDNRMVQLMDICCQLSCVGFCVVIVCDGAVRHHTKRASIQRQSSNFCTKVQSHLLRLQLMSIADRKKNAVSKEEVTTIEKEEIAVCNNIRSIEKKLQHFSVDVGQKFFEMVEKHVQKIPYADLGKRKGKISVIQAEYQADSVLAHRRVNGISDIVFSSDSDLLAHAGPSCLGIKLYTYTLRGKKSGIDNFEIFTATECMLRQVLSALRYPADHANIKRSKNPIFDRIACPKTRALLAVGLGCDVYKSGVRGISKVLLKQWLDLHKSDYKKEPEVLYKKIMDYFCDRYFCDNTKTKKMVHTKVISDDERILFMKSINILIAAFIYEPCNHVTASWECVDSEDFPIYIHNEKPISLHKYVKDFAHNDESIDIFGEDAELSKCVGIGKSTHTFLTFEGVTHCHTCNITCCKYCTFEIKDDNSDSYSHCSKCFLTKKLVPDFEIEEHLPLEEMITTLHKVSIEVHKDENFDVVLSLYDHFITKKEVIFDDKLLNSCSMPFENSNYFSTEHKLCQFNFMEGGLVLRNNLLTIPNQLQLISLMVKLVTVKPNPKNRNHAVVPEFLVNSATNSRIRGGDRLIERAVRHSVDADRKEIINSKAALILYKGNIGINIVTSVRASMKKISYNVCVSFNENGIIANTCSCKVGCYGHERIMCIHVLPVIQQLSLLVYKRLACDILYHLNQLWDFSFESQISPEDTQQLKNNILSLVRACNKYDSKIYNNENQSVTDLLKTFDTGTQKPKVSPGPPTSKAKLGPLRFVRFESPNMTTAKDIITPESDEPDDKEGPVIFNDLPPKQDIPYNQMFNMIKFIREQFPCDDEKLFTDCVGFNLLGMRASQAGSYFDVISPEMKTQLTDLLTKGNLSNRVAKPRKKKKQVSASDLDSESQSDPESDDSDPDTDRESVSAPESDDSDPESDCESESVSQAEKASATEATPIIGTSTDDVESESVSQAEKASATEATPIIGTSTDDVEVRRIYNRKCGVPNCKYNNNPDRFFRRFPACPARNLSQSTDKVRRTHALKLFKRNGWLTRFGLTDAKCTPHLLFCCGHVIESTEVSFAWKKKDGNVVMETVFIDLPKEEDAPILLTRNDHRKRKKVNYVIKHKKSRVPRAKTTITKPKIGRWCCYVNCNVNSDIPGTVFSRVPPMPKVPDRKSSNAMRHSYAKRLCYRLEFLRRIGASTNDSRVDIRICNNHLVEKISKPITYEKQNGTINNATIWFNVPSAYTQRSNMNTNSATKHRTNKGSAYKRFESNYLQKSKEAVKSRIDFDWAYCTYEVCQENERARSKEKAGLSSPERQKPVYGIINKKRPLPREKQPTVIQIYKTNNFIIAKTTGFRSMASMLSFIIIVCNGDIATMSTTTTTLSWIEEWYMYFERVYGRSVRRMVDCSMKYKASIRMLRTIFINKLKLVNATRTRWPMFVSMEEDHKLRDDKWDSTYEGKRIIMWDNTDVPLATPSNANLQRNTWSDYYNGNVGKGSVFIQLCGWMGTHELWEGAVSDTDYFTRSGILQLQQQYMEMYDSAASDSEWNIILDRGYKVVGQCFATGKQKCIQPTFTRSSDPKFSGNDTQLTAAVASDRGANERAVRIAKLSKYVEDGYKQTVTVDQLCDVWLAWGFQANFMYKAVL